MPNSWVLAGARVALGPEKSVKADIEIRSGRIAAILPSLKAVPGARHLDLSGCLILPGLINAHDHLEFNLFPRLGRGPYPNAGAWARDIYHPDRPPLCEHLQVSMATRLRWGAVKNLLSGVTTVCHHNPYNARVFSREFPVRVARRYGWCHSLEFSPDVVDRFKRTPRHWPFVLHLGEAVDGPGKREILRLDGLGALDSRTVLVHAVALGTRGLRLVRERGASLVWCPSSNSFILGSTLDGETFDCGVALALGTDSALSGKGDLLDEIQFAREVSGLPVSRLYEMVTREAAHIMRLRRGEGTLRVGGTADLIVAPDRGLTPASTLAELRAGMLEMVLVRGEVGLVSGTRVRQMPAATRSLLSPIAFGEPMQRTFISADVSDLFGQVEPVLGSVVLAGKKVRRPS